MSLVLEALQKQSVEKQIKEIFPEKKLIKPIKTLHSGKEKKSTKKKLRSVIYLSFSISLLIIITSVSIAKVFPILRERVTSSSISSPMITNPIPSQNYQFNPLNLKVKGIVWDTKNPIVLIEDRFLTVGDEFMGVKIKKVYLNKVLVEYDGKEHYLYVE